jgi:PAS domain S-box-containing protein
MNNQLVIASKFFLIAIAFSYPIIGYVYDAYAGMNDSFLIRLLFSLLCVSTFVVISKSFSIQQIHWKITRVFFTAVGLHLYYLTLTNDLHPFYFATIPFFIISTPLFYTRYKILLPLLTVVLAVTIGVGVFHSESEFIYFYYALLSLSIPVALFNLYLFRKVIKKMQFSDYVLNNIDALVLASNEKGEITYSSKNIKQLIGYSRKEVLGRGWWNIRLKRLTSDDELKDFQASLIQRTDSKEGQDLKITTKNNVEKWFHWKVVNLNNKTNFGIGYDITAKKKVEEELKKLSLIAQETDNLVMLLDINNNIEWVNPAFCKLTQVEENHSIHKNIGDFLLGKCTDKEGFLKTLSVVSNEKTMHYGEFQLQKRDGTCFWVNISFSPIIENGQVTRIICIGRDSSLTKEAETKIKLYNERIRALHQLDRKLFEAETIDDIVTEIAFNAKSFGVNCNRVSIAMIENEGNADIKVVSKNPKVRGAVTEDIFPLSDFDKTFKALKTAEYVLNDLEKLDNATSTQSFLKEIRGINAYISLPIKYKDKLIGSLNFGSESKLNFTEEVINYLTDISLDVALAVYQYQLKVSIQSKNSKIKQRNEDITDSINYAKRIQTAIFPDQHDLNELFDDNFILFKPKDTLSGDFYWVEETPEAIWIAVADSTGHGVPGAFVSLVGTNILNQAVFEKKLKTPDEVLAYLNLKTIRTFSSQNDSSVKDAMDIGICCILKGTNKLLYAGVLNDLHLIRDQNFITFKSSRFPIGIKPERVYLDFELHEIELQENDQFYLMSDGVADQFGGESNKKFGKKQLKELMLKLSDYSMKEQLRIATNSIELWKKDEEQTDDMIFVGFKPKFDQTNSTTNDTTHQINDKNHSNIHLSL